MTPEAAALLFDRYGNVGEAASLLHVVPDPRQIREAELQAASQVRAAAAAMRAHHGVGLVKYFDDNDTPEQQVTKGASVLDSIAPWWANLVYNARSTLSVRNPFACVLTTVFGGFQIGIDVFASAGICVRGLGFACEDKHDHHYSQLWIAEAKKRCSRF